MVLFGSVLQLFTPSPLIHTCPPLNHTCPLLIRTCPCSFTRAPCSFIRAPCSFTRAGGQECNGFIPMSVAPAAVPHFRSMMALPPAVPSHYSYPHADTHTTHADTHTPHTDTDTHTRVRVVRSSPAFSARAHSVVQRPLSPPPTPTPITTPTPWTRPPVSAALRSRDRFSVLPASGCYIRAESVAFLTTPFASPSHLVFLAGPQTSVVSLAPLKNQFELLGITVQVHDVGANPVLDLSAQSSISLSLVQINTTQPARVLALSTNDTAGSLLGVLTQAVDPHTAVATFSNLSVDKVGFYQLIVRACICTRLCARVYVRTCIRCARVYVRT